jgi:hypothetical protein
VEEKPSLEVNDYEIGSKLGGKIGVSFKGESRCYRGEKFPYGPCI